MDHDSTEPIELSAKDEADLADLAALATEEHIALAEELEALATEEGASLVDELVSAEEVAAAIAGEDDLVPGPDGSAPPENVNVDVLQLAMVSIEPMVGEMLAGRLNRDRRIELSIALSGIALADATRQKLMLDKQMLQQAGLAPQASGLVVPR